MSTKTLVGATMSGALTFVTCSVGAHLDQNVSLLAAVGVAAIVGSGLHFSTPKKEEPTAEQEEWEKELLKGGKAELSAEEIKAEEAKAKNFEEV